MPRKPKPAVCILAAVACTLPMCGNSTTVEPSTDDEITAPWAALFWINSNSGPTFSWSLDGVVATTYVAAPMNGQPSQDGSGTPCAPFGGSVTPGVGAESMQSALPEGARFELWMQPRDDEFAGVSEQGLKAAVEAELEWFQSCVEQDWPEAPTVQGFVCVKEQQLGGAANCDTLQAVFQQGVQVTGAAGAVRYGILSAPGGMNRTDIDAALGEMYEPIYFPPSNRCPDSSDGSTYGAEIGSWIASAAVIPPSDSVAVPVFGGPSSTCVLAYDQLAPAAAALSDAVPSGLAGLGLWG